ncbi:MAG TPA: DoxX family protein [Cellulomonas sp.]
MLLRRIARPLFASWFLSEGLDAVRHPGPHVEAARGALDRFGAVLPAGARDGLERLRDPADRQLTRAVRAHGAATALAALLLATGRAPRSAALVLAGLTLPLAVADAPERPHLHVGPIGRGGGTAEDAAAERARRRARTQRLVRSLAFTGGALLVAADTEGRPGLAWRVEHARATRLAAERAAAVQEAVTGR